MQQVLSALGMTVFITWITGDVSDLVSNAPYALLTLSYSREFERQADLYAMESLNRQQIPVSYFASFLKRMGKDDADIELLSTHPATTTRVQAVEAFARQQNPGAGNQQQGQSEK
jgi:predicted Zn-dependent protease